MELMKINTLSEAATQIFRRNLTNEGAPFKQLGSAFVIPKNVSYFHPNSFDGLWQGYEANIEIQDVEDGDISAFFDKNKGNFSYEYA